MRIEHLRVTEYGCVKDAELELTALHAFVGPNDAGKSTLLRAVQDALAALTIGTTPSDRWRAGSGVILRTDAGVEASVPAAGVPVLNVAGVSVPHGNELRAGLLRGDPLVVVGGNVKAGGRTLPAGTHLTWPAHDVTQLIERGALRPLPEATTALRDFYTWATPGRLVRLEPDALRLGTSIFQKGADLTFASDRGQGLPSLLDALRDRDDGSYEEIRARILALFPSVRLLQLHASESGGAKQIGVTLQDGTVVKASELSEGFLYMLAFLVLEHAAPASVVLLEEPENGLHPGRIREVVQSLRRLSERSQVLMATHSPLIVNELQPDEVTVVTRDPVKGTKGTRLSQTTDFAQRSRVYENGELWLSYGDAESEKALVPTETGP